MLGLKPLETGPTIGPEEGKADMVVPCTGAGRAEFAKDRLFRDVILLSRLLVRSLVCKKNKSNNNSTHFLQVVYVCLGKRFWVHL